MTTKESCAEGMNPPRNAQPTGRTKLAGLVKQCLFTLDLVIILSVLFLALVCIITMLVLLIIYYIVKRYYTR